MRLWAKPSVHGETNPGNPVSVKPIYWGEGRVSVTSKLLRMPPSSGLTFTPIPPKSSVANRQPTLLHAAHAQPTEVAKVLHVGTSLP